MVKRKRKSPTPITPRASKRIKTLEAKKSNDVVVDNPDPYDVSGIFEDEKTYIPSAPIIPKGIIDRFKAGAKKLVRRNKKATKTPLINSSKKSPVENLEKLAENDLTDLPSIPNKIPDNTNEKIAEQTTELIEQASPVLNESSNITSVTAKRKSFLVSVEKLALEDRFKSPCHRKNLNSTAIQEQKSPVKLNLTNSGSHDESNNKNLTPPVDLDQELDKDEVSDSEQNKENSFLQISPKKSPLRHRHQSNISRQSKESTEMESFYENLAAKIREFTDHELTVEEDK